MTKIILSSAISFILLIIFTILYQIILLKIIKKLYNKQKNNWENEIVIPYKYKNNWEQYLSIIILFSVLFMSIPVYYIIKLLNLVNVKYDSTFWFFIIMLLIMFIIVIILIIIVLFKTTKEVYITENDVIEIKIFNKILFKKDEIKKIKYCFFKGNYEIVFINNRNKKIKIYSGFKKIYEFDRLYEKLKDIYKNPAVFT